MDKILELIGEGILCYECERETKEDYGFPIKCSECDRKFETLEGLK